MITNATSTIGSSRINYSTLFGDCPLSNLGNQGVALISSVAHVLLTRPKCENCSTFKTIDCHWVQLTPTTIAQTQRFNSISQKITTLKILKLWEGEIFISRCYEQSDQCNNLIDHLASKAIQLTGGLLFLYFCDSVHHVSDDSLTPEE